MCLLRRIIIIEKLKFQFSFFAPIVCLFEATKKGDLDQVKFLLKKDSSLSPISKDYYGLSSINRRYIVQRTPFHVASSEGHKELVSFFLNFEHKLDPFPRDQDGRTPLHEAAFNGHKDIVSLFLNLEPKINPMLQDTNDRTPLHDAASTGQSEIVSMFLNFDYNFNHMMKDKDLKTPLHFAIENGYTNVVREFLMIKPNVNLLIKGPDGKTFLHEASERGYLVIVQLIIDLLRKRNREEEGISNFCHQKKQKNE